MAADPRDKHNLAVSRYCNNVMGTTRGQCSASLYKSDIVRHLLYI